MHSPDDQSWIIYDGQCPFCTNSVRLLRLQEAVGAVHLVDARHSDPPVESAREKGFDLDEGMIFPYGGRDYFRADPAHMLAMLSSPISRFNRLNSRIFGSRLLAGILYPVLRLGRTVTF